MYLTQKKPGGTPKKDRRPAGRFLVSGIITVGETLRKARVADPRRHVTRAGAFALGLLVPLLLSGNASGLPWPWWVAAVAVALLGLRLGNSIRTPLAWGLSVFIVASFVVGSVWSG